MRLNMNPKSAAKIKGGQPSGKRPAVHSTAFIFMMVASEPFCRAAS